MALLDEAVPFASNAAKKSGEWYLTPNGNVVAGTIAAAAAEDGLNTDIRPKHDCGRIHRPHFPEPAAQAPGISDR